MIFEYLQPFQLLFSLVILIINFLYGSFVINTNQDLNNKNSNSLIKIVSPKIDIERYFTNENPEKIILELVKLSDPEDIEKTILFCKKINIIFMTTIQDPLNLKMMKKLIGFVH